MPPQLESVVVPWFSRQEWLEVFRGAYSNDVDRWKEARDTMLVWQARVSKLPIGVDLTLPLLQAKIVDADPLVDSDLKSIMLGTSLQRFVSNVVKLPQTKHYHNQGMHKLAASIGLPAHLVDLRNEIIHGDTGWTGGCTVLEALETSYQWIKNYYWYPECHQMKKKGRLNVHQVPTADWQYLLSELDFYTKTMYVDAYDRKHAKDDRIEASNSVIQAIQHICSINQKECMEAVVMHLFSPADISEKMYKQSGKKAKCRCFFHPDVVAAMDMILSSLLVVEGSTELLLSCLINKAQESTENKEISIEWIYLLIRSFIKLPCRKGEKDGCRKHLLHVNQDFAVNWKSVVYKLLNTEEEWAANLAVRVMNAAETSFSKSQVKQISDLLKLVNCYDIDAAKQGEEMYSEITDADIYDIDSVLGEIHKHSSDALKITEKIKTSVFPPSSVTSSTGGRTPLGILPHQKNNRQFYKELLLHYPGDRDDEPPLKRKKT